MMMSGASMWALSIGVFDETKFMPIDKWGSMISEPLLVVARPIGEELSGIEGFNFRIRDASKRILWEVDTLSYEIPLRGRGLVGDCALLPEVAVQLAGNDLRLSLEFGDQTIATLLLSPPPKVRAALTSNEPSRLGGLAEGDTPSNVSEEDLIRSCGQLCEELYRLQNHEDAADLELKRMQAQLETWSKAEIDSEQQARDLIGSLSMGEVGWIAQLSNVIDDIRQNLNAWQGLLEPLGTGAEREKLIGFLGQAATVRSFYQLRDWGWLADSIAVRERRNMIETFLKRHEQHGFQS
jgi:hypothetical protein